MTIDEAIRNAEENACSSCSEYASEHRQLASWLKQVKIIDELVEAFCKFNHCFIGLCEICGHKKCKSPNLVASNLANKIYEWTKIRNPKVTKQEFMKFLNNGIWS